MKKLQCYFIYFLCNYQIYFYLKTRKFSICKTTFFIFFSFKQTGINKLEEVSLAGFIFICFVSSIWSVDGEKTNGN